jgi:dihydrofolate synthase / folylpolyglutamate synthase
MTPDPLLDWLARRTTGGIRWGLERTESLLAGVGDPHRRFQSVHIGGTNGKGSVAVLCAEALRCDRPGRRVGLYTSPHLVDFRERIRIDGRPVAEAVLRAAVDDLRAAIERSGATFFEATTALAFQCFARAGVELAVVEVGLGGRLDATNVIVPLATGVTGIGLDHTEYLGDTRESIAQEKAGIFKEGVPAITAERDAGVLDVLRDRAAHVGAPFAALDEVADCRLVARSADGVRVRLRSRAWGEREFGIGLPGAHQARNAALAAELLALLPPAERPAWDAVAAGFAAARWPGRLQRARAWGTNWLLDVAHNPDGVRALAEELDHGEDPVPRVLLCAILGDKDHAEMLRPLLERVDAAVLTVAPSSPTARRWDPTAAAADHAAHGVPVRVIPDFEQALLRASTLAAHGTVVVTGSVHTVGDAMVLLDLPVA